MVRQSAAKFRQHVFEEQELDDSTKALESPQAPTMLETHTDTVGQSWPQGQSPRGGSRIFEYQSQCPFRSYATHRLGLQADDEAEFGLDNLDRGSIVHYLMELFWTEVKTQKRLNQLALTERAELVATIVARGIEAPSLNLSCEKRTLLRHEVSRLVTLMTDWLEQEIARPEPFTLSLIHI